jgi:hypothetical protein
MLASTAMFRTILQQVVTYQPLQLTRVLLLFPGGFLWASSSPCDSIYGDAEGRNKQVLVSSCLHHKWSSNSKQHQAANRLGCLLCWRHRQFHQARGSGTGQQLYLYADGWVLFLLLRAL